ncbi:flagellar flavodoxin [Dorcoceras hygrometricum]|uniref:Flagellar flavodoxin n=1 Tax=Dorcoceras hygrometricum TaxID=472368 RepID=A0A2Z7D3M7_9LAMI|nr:flagellar flavodoxin [Dorcoceras hygrometricum]
MEHSGMVHMFKTLENARLKGFFNVTGSVYENVVVEFFATAKVIAATVVSTHSILITPAGDAQASIVGGPEVDTDTRTGDAYIADSPEDHESTCDARTQRGHETWGKQKFSNKRRLKDNFL